MSTIAVKEFRSFFVNTGSILSTTAACCLCVLPLFYWACAGDRDAQPAPRREGPLFPQLRQRGVQEPDASRHLHRGDDGSVSVGFRLHDVTFNHGQHHRRLLISIGSTKSGVCDKTSGIFTVCEGHLHNFFIAIFVVVIGVDISYD